MNSDYLPTVDAPPQSREQRTELIGETTIHVRNGTPASHVYLSEIRIRTADNDFGIEVAKLDIFFYLLEPLDPCAVKYDFKTRLGCTQPS